MKLEKINNQEEFWEKRAVKYNKLDWVSEPDYIKTLISSVEFEKDDFVLDVGTGTGVIAHAIAPLVKEIIGVDISRDMLSHSEWTGNKYFVRRDIKDSFFCEGVFDKITARMVFHHIIEGTQRAMDECYNILKDGGCMMVSEGVPPVAELKEDYQRIFELKEKRITFSEEDLRELMSKSGFKDIKVTTYIMKNFSVKNWLRNSAASQENQDKIFDMHVNSSDLFKKSYNLKMTDGDCLIDVKNIIIKGYKGGKK